MKKYLILLLMPMIFTSCYTTKVIPINETLNTYFGASEYQVIMQLGPPSVTKSDGNGGKILIYENTKSLTYYIPGPANTNISGFAKTVDRSSYLHFYINSQDEVYKWNTNYPDKEEKELNKGKTAIAIVSTVLGTVLYLILLAG